MPADPRHIIVTPRGRPRNPWSIDEVAWPDYCCAMLIDAEGRYLFDADGNKFLDLGSGLIAVNLGHGHPKVVKAIQDQAATLCYAAPGLFNDKRAELAAELSDMSPWKGEGCRTFFTTTGAESNDDAVRLARSITGRTKVLTAYRSFHGSTGTSIMLTGEDRRFGGEPGGPGVMRFFAPYPYRSPFWATSPEEETARAIEHLERTLVHEDPKRVAAILIEPVVGSNGVIVYPNFRKGRDSVTHDLNDEIAALPLTDAEFTVRRCGVDGQH